MTFPLIFHLGTYTTGAGDELLIAWIHSWVIHALFTNPLTLFNANIYYPYNNSLAFSDVFLIGGLLTGPFVYFFGQPIVANNITLIYSLFLLGFSMYLLSYYLTNNHTAALLAGLLVIFSPATLSNAVQIQMLEIYWVPLALLFFFLFLNTNKSRFFLLFLLSFLLQFYNSFLPAYFILFSSIIIFLFTWFEKKKKIAVYFTSKNIWFMIVTFFLLIPLVIPYFQVSKEFHYARDLRDSIHFALQPEDLLYPGVNTRLNSFLISIIPTNHYSQNNEFKPGYVGFIFSLLVIISIGFILKNRKKVSLYDKIFITVSFVGLILSFGPFLHLNRQTIHHPFPVPLPYLLFYYIMPGFQGFRNSQRWEMLFIIGIAILVSLVLNKLLINVPFKKQIVVYSLLIIGVVLEFSPFTYIIVPQKKDFPKIYSWMATTPKNAAFIILPIYNWNMNPNVGQELYREYFSTSEFRPMVNGYSGFSPPPWQDFVVSIHNNFPNNENSNKLKFLKVNYIIIDKATYDKEHSVDIHYPNGSTIVSELKQIKNLTFIKNVDNYAVFAIGEKK